MRIPGVGDDFKVQKFCDTDQGCGTFPHAYSNLHDTKEDNNKQLIDLNVIPELDQVYFEFHNHIIPDQSSGPSISLRSFDKQLTPMTSQSSGERMGSLVELDHITESPPVPQDPSSEGITPETMAPLFQYDDGDRKRRKYTNYLPLGDVKGKKPITEPLDEIAPGLQNESFNSQIPESQYVVPHLLIGFLQWQYSLAIWKKDGLSEEIKDAFDSLKHLASLDIPDSVNEKAISSKINLAINKIKTDLVTGVIGALNMISWQGEKVSTPINVLIQDAWEFLHKFLKEDITSFKEQYLCPSTRGMKKCRRLPFGSENLLSYTMSLKDDNKIPPQTTHRMLQIWASSSIYRDSIPESSLNYLSFIHSSKNDQSLTALPQGKVMLSQSLVQKAFKRAKEDITPAFMGILWLMHPGLEVYKNWDEIYESGWKFLEAYFSRWTSYLAKSNDPITLTPIEGKTIAEDCSDFKGIMQYLGNLGSTRYIPMTLIWHLADLWYEEKIILKKSEIIYSRFDKLKPDRTAIKMKCLKLSEGSFNAKGPRKSSEM
ncbi:uncharacterized protein MELLADRAFT_107212 [Melampsora larici-populina 98AG31]|uniref:Uncharacterized protein n=1 Tax=Melampsora larici-populina (strain 98AG31 / pathotype 3-4-7) TaxID=747676 RepID=F4RP72_MELLP|nr:uncharacterized protein MELLADRAFT_107212 [Melampsora larici-populina 98AG31]EGG05768.1 hypothetical protein MELLADRAFT_107212 [Melampsora larici-populina 98AG31]